MTSSDLVIGGFYGFRYQDEILVYVGKYGAWHQFEKLDVAGKVWCEILDTDLDMIEVRD